MELSIYPLAIPDVKLIKARRFSDPRGYFAETYTRRDFSAHGIADEFVQDNESMSAMTGTVRGLHFQVPPFAQSKLVRVLSGRILDVVVDLRRTSSSFGRHVAIELSAEVGEQLFVPIGFAHGFCTLEPHTVVLYKVDRFYSRAHDRGINWADPALGIDWLVETSRATLSDRDLSLPKLDELPEVFH